MKIKENKNKMKDQRKSKVRNKEHWKKMKEKL